MLRTLYAKLVAVLLGLLCLIGILYVVLTLFTTRAYQQEVTQKLHSSLAKHVASERVLMSGGRVNDAALKEIFDMLMAVNPSIEIYLLAPDGTILAYSAPPGKVRRQQVALEPLTRFLSGADLPIRGDDPRDPGRKKVFSVAPIPLKGAGETNGRIEGYLYVILGGEEYDSVAHMLQGSYILRLSTAAAVAGIVFTLLAGLLFFNLLTRRLRKLVAAVEAFTRSEFSARPETPHFRASSGDEIDHLETAFHRMAARIVRQMTQLQETDTLRRELVANVSHDLRTPLTSLHGYLETLLMKEGTLSSQEQRSYLEIATKHSEQLGTLIAELFELTKLDSLEMEPHLEPFSLSDLVQDVVQQFQLLAQKKVIKLQINVHAQLPFVVADIGLIERVLENLIENALRYTPEGGTITVALIPSENHIAVHVTDTGCGIPAHDLPYIFDRFYQVKKNQQEKSEGLGLGLAIAKRILELHGGVIEVVSTSNVGTVFAFGLPIYHSTSPS